MKESVIRPRPPQPTPVGAVTELPDAWDLSVHFEGLANPTRLKIVERLAVAAEVRVSELAELCRVSQPRMSWHLRILRRAQVILTRREGREVYCRLDRDAIAQHLQRFAHLVSLSVSGTAAETLQIVNEGAP